MTTPTIQGETLHQERMADIAGRTGALRQYIGEQILATLNSSRPGLLVPKGELTIISDMMAQWFINATEKDSYGLIASQQAQAVREVLERVKDYAPLTTYIELCNFCDNILATLPLPGTKGALMTDDISGWFELSYAQYLTVPRSIMQEMPDEWQARMAQCLHELDDTFDWRPKSGRYWCRLRDDNGRFTDDPLMQYRHPNYAYIASIKKKVQCTDTAPVRYGFEDAGFIDHKD